MPSGGHASSGPAPDPNSLRSAQKGRTFEALPAAGYDGDIPPFPLPDINVFDVYYEGRSRVREFDPGATVARHNREVELWAQAWRTPQAAAWAREPWRWSAVAMWVRTMVVCESAEASAADKGSLHRFADQIGLTPAGMAFNGWKVASDQLAERRADKVPAVAPSARSRLKAVRDAAGG